MFKTYVSLALFVTVGAGCHSGSSSPPVDASVYDLALDLPPGCPPAAANEKGVGLPCTPGGKECTKPGIPSGLLCTCDAAFGLKLNGVPCICTLAGPNLTTNPDPCSTQASGLCGTEATCCNYMTEGYFCSPNVCLPGGNCIDFEQASPDGG